MRTTNLLGMLALSTSLYACADDAAPEPDVLALPGQAYYPESLGSAPDGTLYVGSLTTGAVVAFDRGATEPREVIAAGANGVIGVTGVAIADDQLWLCSVDTTFQRATEVRSFTLDGQPIASYPLPSTMFCNDLAFDAGTVYATDSFSGSIQRLAPGASAFETFVTDPRFVPDATGAFGLDGVAVVGDRLIVNKLDTGELFAVSRSGEIEELELPLSGPDGMRPLDDHRLLVIEGGANRLTELDFSGDAITATTLAENLDMPTGVTVARGSAWVTEGQLGRLFANPALPPNLPFAVRRIDL